MTRETAESMDQRSFGRSCTVEAAEETVSAALGFLGTRQNGSVRTVTGIHPGNVSLSCLGRGTSCRVSRDRHQNLED